MSFPSLPFSIHSFHSAPLPPPLSAARQQLFNNYCVDVNADRGECSAPASSPLPDPIENNKLEAANYKRLIVDLSWSDQQALINLNYIRFASAKAAALHSAVGLCTVHIKPAFRRLMAGAIRALTLVPAPFKCIFTTFLCEIRRRNAGLVNVALSLHFECVPLRVLRLPARTHSRRARATRRRCDCDGKRSQ